MKDDQFDKLFNYLQRLDRRLETVEQNMATKESIDRLIGAMDDFNHVAKSLEVSKLNP